MPRWWDRRIWAGVFLGLNRFQKERPLFRPTGSRVDSEDSGEEWMGGEKHSWTLPPTSNPITASFGWYEPSLYILYNLNTELCNESLQNVETSK
jgi:hypothetical protein